MKMIKNIVARIWAVWGLISFVVTFLIIFLPSMIAYLLPEKIGQAYFISVSKFWMNIWLFLVGCPVKIVGREHFKKGVTYIVTSNHNSLMDVPLTSPYIPGANRTIAKKSFAKIPLFGWYYRKGSVLVDRSNDQSRKRSYDLMKATLKAGIHMCIYPEGTRNRTAAQLQPFYNGAFKLAVDTQTNIIPAIIFNTKKVLPPNKWMYMLPHRIEMHFLPEIIAKNKSADQLKAEVYEIMYNYYATNAR